MPGVSAVTWHINLMIAALGVAGQPMLVTRNRTGAVDVLPPVS
jgi:hypothetical protein